MSLRREKLKAIEQSWLFVGISHPTKQKSDPRDKKFSGYPEGEKSRKNLECRGYSSRGFCINPGDFAKIPGIKIQKLRKIPIPGIKNPESRGFSENPEKIPKGIKPFYLFHSLKPKNF